MRSWDHKTKKVNLYQTFWPKIPRAENYRTVAALRYVGYRFWFWRNFDGLCGATKQSGTPRGSEPRWTSSRGGEPEAAASLLTGNLAHFRKKVDFSWFCGVWQGKVKKCCFWPKFTFFYVKFIEKSRFLGGKKMVKNEQNFGTWLVNSPHLFDFFGFFLPQIPS